MVYEAPVTVDVDGAQVGHTRFLPEFFQDGAPEFLVSNGEKGLENSGSGELRLLFARLPRDFNKQTCQEPSRREMQHG